MHSADLYPLAQRLYALIHEPLHRWAGKVMDPGDRGRLANTLLMELTAVPGAPIAEDDQEGFAQAVIISEALATLAMARRLAGDASARQGKSVFPPTRGPAL